MLHHYIYLGFRLFCFLLFTPFFAFIFRILHILSFLFTCLSFKASLPCLFSSVLFFFLFSPPVSIPFTSSSSHYLSFQFLPLLVPVPFFHSPPPSYRVVLLPRPFPTLILRCEGESLPARTWRPPSCYRLTPSSDAFSAVRST